MAGILADTIQSWNFWIVVLVIWSLPWKGMALWRAARRHELWWFVAFFIVNTFGILEILYLLIWSKRPSRPGAISEKPTPSDTDAMFQK